MNLLCLIIALTALTPKIVSQASTPSISNTSPPLQADPKIKTPNNSNLPFSTFVLPKLQEIVNLACGITLGNIIDINYTVTSEISYDIVMETQYGDLYAEASVQFVEGTLTINKIDFINSTTFNVKLASPLPVPINGNKNIITVRKTTNDFLKFNLPPDPNLNAALLRNQPQNQISSPTARPIIKPIDNTTNTSSGTIKIQKYETHPIFTSLKQKCDNFNATRKISSKVGASPLLTVSSRTSATGPAGPVPNTGIQTPVVSSAPFGITGSTMSLSAFIAGLNQNLLQTPKNIMDAVASSITPVATMTTSPVATSTAAVDAMPITSSFPTDNSITTAQIDPVVANTTSNSNSTTTLLSNIASGSSNVTATENLSARPIKTTSSISTSTTVTSIAGAANPPPALVPVTVPATTTSSNISTNLRTNLRVTI